MAIGAIARVAGSVGRMIGSKNVGGRRVSRFGYDTETGQAKGFWKGASEKVSGATGRVQENVNNMFLDRLKKQKANEAGDKKTSKMSLKKLTGVQLSTSSMLRQSQLFTTTVGSVFQMIGAIMDMLLMPLVPLMLPLFHEIASIMPQIMRLSNLLTQLTGSIDKQLPGGIGEFLQKTKIFPTSMGGFIAMAANPQKYFMDKLMAGLTKVSTEEGSGFWDAARDSSWWEEKWNKAKELIGIGKDVATTTKLLPEHDDRVTGVVDPSATGAIWNKDASMHLRAKMAERGRRAAEKINREAVETARISAEGPGYAARNYGGGQDFMDKLADNWLASTQSGLQHNLNTHSQMVQNNNVTNFQDKQLLVENKDLITNNQHSLIMGETALIELYEAGT